MLILGMVGIMKVNIQGVIEDYLCLVKRHIVVREISFGLFIVPLKLHSNPRPVSLR